MAVRIELSDGALARIRFGVSPAYETIKALQVLRQPGVHAVHLRWVRWARSRLAGVADLGLLLRTAVDSRLIPSYLVPPPDVRMPDFAVELKRIRATPTAQIAKLGEEPRKTLARLAGALEACHDLLIAPHWTRMTTLLEADIAYRAGVLARGGYAGLFADLHTDVRWADGELTVHPTRMDLVERTRPEKNGLVLCPSVFCWPQVTTAIRTRGAGTLRYPARGVAGLWDEPEPAPEAIAALIGQTRAAILTALSAPATTKDLAHMFGVTAGAISQHLGVLRDAGLVTTHRDGRTVLHLRTARAESLLEISS